MGGVGVVVAHTILKTAQIPPFPLLDVTLWIWGLDFGLGLGLHQCQAQKTVEIGPSPYLHVTII